MYKVINILIDSEKQDTMLEAMLHVSSWDGQGCC